MKGHRGFNWLVLLYCVPRGAINLPSKVFVPCSELTTQARYTEAPVRIVFVDKLDLATKWKGLIKSVIDTNKMLFPVAVHLPF